MKAGLKCARFSTGLAAAATALLLIGLVQPTRAQDCKSLPFGPEKRQCLTQKNPDAIQKKLQRCKALAEQRAGSLDGRGTGKKGFVQSCLQGKVSS